jgi:chitin synthase
MTAFIAWQLHVTVFLPKGTLLESYCHPPALLTYTSFLYSHFSLMDSRGDQRPPRSTRPGSSQPASPAPAYPDSAAYSRPPLSSNESSKANVSFQNVEKGDRNDHLDPHRQRTLASAYHPQLTDPEYSDQFDPSRVARKKSLVKPDREKIDQNHRQWHYRSHVAQLEEEGNTRVGVLPSSTHTC